MRVFLTCYATAIALMVDVTYVNKYMCALGSSNEEKAQCIKRVTKGV
jgi:hypothetical protein